MAKTVRRKGRQEHGASRTRQVHLNRALSKLGILTRSQATEAILAGRVSVNGRVVDNPGQDVDLSATITLDGEGQAGVAPKTVVFNKPRGALTARKDPQGRPTIYDVLGDAGRGLVPVGRLDPATSGLLLLTTDTSLASWIENPDNAVPRVYVATVRGEMTDEEARRMMGGINDAGDRLQASHVTLRKASGRESHLTIELREGKNREVRRLCAALGHAVTRLKRVQLGGLTLGELAPGAWRQLEASEIRRAFPGAPTPAKASRNHPGAAS